MQLPDNCFGRRWPVGVYTFEMSVGTYYDISEAGLGDRCVFWNLFGYAAGSTMGWTVFSFALGDQLPVNDAEFDALEPLFSDVGLLLPPRRELAVGGATGPVFLPMRLPVQAQGRRIVGRFDIQGASSAPPESPIPAI